MAFRIIKTTDDQHVGTVLDHIEAGQIVTFADGDVVEINEIFISDGGNLLACGVNYQMTLIQE